eukprot:Clim_evm138s210 gene=Clim_evmTU138s210
MKMFVARGAFNALKSSSSLAAVTKNTSALPVSIFRSIGSDSRKSGQAAAATDSTSDAHGEQVTPDPAVQLTNERDLKFNLWEVLEAEKTLEYPYFKEHGHTRDVCDQSVEGAVSVAQQYFAPINRLTDTKEPQYVDGQAITPEETKTAYREFCNGGFMQAQFPPELGGLGLPMSVAQTCFYPFNVGCVGVSTYGFLTIGASNLLHSVGSQDLIDKFMPDMVSGRFAGTMCLSEPNAGSSLADIRTTAEPQSDGSYKLKGTKMWISGGEQDITENIVHLVLAKVKGTKGKGVKGISLFLVPKVHVNDDGSLGEKNDIALAGLNHKMGWRATTNTLLNFGENDNCVGWMVGEEGKGLAGMFNMMNEARIGVGLTAVALGYQGYSYSLHYCRNRLQGRPASNKDPDSEQIPINAHADVRRMLVAQKAYVEGALSLCLYAANLEDQRRHAPDESTKIKANHLLDILIPICKSWPSEWCLEANKWAIQCLGGYGFTVDYPVEQSYRDNRLNMIHEGTNGIQSMDLLGRKVPQHKGETLKALLGTITETLEESKASDARVQQLGKTLDSTIKSLSGVTVHLMGEAQSKGPQYMLANSHDYLNAFGHTVIGWLWLKQAVVAQKALDAGSVSASDQAFYQGKIATAEYFMNHELPRANGLIDLLKSNPDTYLRLDVNSL